ncbi:hypothetical protein [Pedobacter foliorum]|uniref:hypothetical protein n=1 Tax=Pedobacter foliorum TaxID=2739058 RepID=UPI001FEB083F|nr:hypothetical protein [Pedobacter foliorum]
MKLSFPIENFLEMAADDSRLLPSHISLFMAIFYYSPADPKAVFRVCRRKLMQFSRIRSLSTYHKCMAELVAYGYINYQPSYDPIRASTVSLIHIENG